MNQKTHEHSEKVNWAQKNIYKLVRIEKMINVVNWQHIQINKKEK